MPTKATKNGNLILSLSVDRKDFATLILWFEKNQRSVPSKSKLMALSLKTFAEFLAQQDVSLDVQSLNQADQIIEKAYNAVKPEEKTLTLKPTTETLTPAFESFSSERNENFQARKKSEALDALEKLELENRALERELELKRQKQTIKETMASGGFLDVVKSSKSEA